MNKIFAKILSFILIIFSFFVILDNAYPVFAQEIDDAEKVLEEVEELDGGDTISDLWDKIVNTFSFGLAEQIGESNESGNRKCIPWYIARTFVNWAAILAGIVLLGYLIYGGVMYMTSSGDPGKTEMGQKTIVNAVIGFAIVILSWTVAGLVMWLFGVNNECIGSSSASDSSSSVASKDSIKSSADANDECYQTCEKKPAYSGGEIVDGECVCF